MWQNYIILIKSEVKNISSPRVFFQPGEFQWPNRKKSFFTKETNALAAKQNPSIQSEQSNPGIHKPSQKLQVGSNLLKNNF